MNTRELLLYDFNMSFMDLDALMVPLGHKA